MKNNIDNNIKECQMCRSKDMSFIKDHNVFDPIEETESLIDVKLCNSCKCIHFYENGHLAYQYVREIADKAEINHLKSDHEVAMMKSRK